LIIREDCRKSENLRFGTCLPNNVSTSADVDAISGPSVIARQQAADPARRTRFFPMSYRNNKHVVRDLSFENLLLQSNTGRIFNKFRRRLRSVRKIPCEYPYDIAFASVSIRHSRSPGSVIRGSFESLNPRTDKINSFFFFIHMIKLPLHSLDRIPRHESPDRLAAVHTHGISLQREEDSMNRNINIARATTSLLASLRRSARRLLRAILRYSLALSYASEHSRRQREK